MDLIGGNGSLATNIHLVIKTVKAIKNLTQSYHNAPAEIKDLRQRLDAVHGQLLLLSRLENTLCTESPTLNLDSSEFDHLTRSLSATKSTFSEILAFLQKKTKKDPSCSRLKWAYFDASKVKGWELRLQRHRELLQTTLILLNRYDDTHCT